MIYPTRRRRAARLLTTSFAFLLLAASPFAASSSARVSLDDKTGKTAAAKKTTTAKATSAAMETPATSLSPTEAAVIAEINLARKDPQAYAALLEELRANYVGNEFRPKGATPRATVEGIAALNEAIAYLRAAKPLPPITLSTGISLAARDHIKDLSAVGGTGHKGSDGSLPEQRLKRYGEWNNAIGENISYGDETAREVVLAMIIDDGNPKRGHRNNLFNAAYNVAGVSLGGRSPQGVLCVISFAGGYIEKAVATDAQANTTKPAARKF